MWEMKQYYWESRSRGISVVMVKVWGLWVQFSWAQNSKNGCSGRRNSNLGKNPWPEFRNKMATAVDGRESPPSDLLGIWKEDVGALNRKTKWRHSSRVFTRYFVRWRTPRPPPPCRRGNGLWIKNKVAGAVDVLEPSSAWLAIRKKDGPVRLGHSEVFSRVENLQTALRSLPSCGW